MKLKIIKFIILISSFPISSANYLTNSEENFEKIFYEYDSCNSEYISFFKSRSMLKDYFNKEATRENYLLENLSEFDIKILQDTIKNYCYPNKIFHKANSNLEKIIESDSSNKIFLLSMHLHTLPIAFTKFKTESNTSFYTIMFDNFSLIRENLDDLKLNDNWQYAITGLYFAIFYTSLSEFSEENSENIYNQNYQNFLLYQLLESVILDSINSDLSYSALGSIAKTLMLTRIKKIEENKYFGTSSEQYLMKEEFFNVYLNNYEDGKIKYREFSIFKVIPEVWRVDHFIEINLDLEDLKSITIMQTDKTTTTKFSDVDIKFTQKILEILSQKFDDNPYEIISRTVFATTMIANKSVDTCLFKDKEIIRTNKLEYFSAITKLNYLKYACNENFEYYKKIIQDLLSGLDLINKDSINISSYESDMIFIEDSAVIFIALINHILQNSEYKFNDKELILSYEFVENIISKFQSEKIGSTDDLLFLGLFETMTFMLNKISLGNTTYEKKLNEIEELIFIKFPFDALAIKKTFTKAIDDKDSDNINELFMSARYTQWYLKYFIYKFYDDKNYLWPSKIIDEISSLKNNDKKYNDLLSNLELLSYVIDSLDNIFKGPDYFLFIFKDQSIDKWYLFRELVPIEIYLKYSLFLSKKITFEEYLALSEKRANQLLKIRPNNIALQKFREGLIEGDHHKSIKNILLDYDNVHNEYLRQRDKQYIIQKSSMNYQIPFLTEYIRDLKFKLLDIEGTLFSEKYEDILPSLFSFESHNVKSLQASLEDHEMIISPVMSPDGMLGFTNFITKDGITSLPFFEPINIYSEILLSQYTNPNSANFEWYASKLYYNLIYSIENILGKDMNQYKDIYIVPDSSMQKIPYHALYDSVSKKWAIEKYNFKYLPSEKLYIYIDKHKISRKQKFVGIGNPSLSNKNLRSQIEKYFNERSEISVNNINELFELPETEDELKNISNFFNSKLLFFQDDAKEYLIHRPYVKDANVMAFATHTVRGIDVNNYFNDRGLVFTPGFDSKKTDEDGFVGSLDISEINLTENPFVMLSACNTFDSPYYKSLPFSGLPKSFMNAGANSVLMSLWNIDSYSAKVFNESLFEKSIFTNSFYLSDSIQESMIDMINSQQYSHPYYWAPYIYLGR